MIFNLQNLSNLSDIEKERLIRFILESIVIVNTSFLRKKFIKLYSNNFSYDKTSDIWQDCKSLLESKKGNCKDFCAWRVAELRLQKIDCEFFIEKNLDYFHITIYHQNGIEDPSIYFEKMKNG